MKIKRYTCYYSNDFGDKYPAESIDCDDGEWVRYEDMQKLATNKKLVKQGKTSGEWFDSVFSVGKERKMSAWIDVKDKLPEPQKYVLVADYSGHITVRYYVPPKGNSCWGWYPGGLPISSSTHWMELPNKPNKKA